MSDGGKSGIAQAFQNIGEAIVNPMKDEVGKAVEQGKQSVFNTNTKPVDPQEEALKKQTEATKMAEAQRVFKFYKDLEEAQRKAREEDKRKQMMRMQGDDQKKQEDQVKQFQIVQKKKENFALSAAKNKSETRKGVGG